MTAFERLLSPEQRDMLERMELVARGRRGGLFRVDLVKAWPDVREFREEIILGKSTWTSVKGRWKLIKENERIETPWGDETPGGVARLYLDTKYAGRRVRCHTRQYERYVINRKGPPHWAQPGHIADALYIDLSAAYWSICRTVGFDCDISPPLFFGVGERMEDFPWSWHKSARISITQSALNSPVTVWTGKRLVTRPMGNRHTNYVLWGVTMDILHAIAHEMRVMADARFIHTDGYIVPASGAGAAFGILESWGLPYKVKAAGSAVVKGINAYRIGDKVTRNFSLVSPHYYRDIQSVDGHEWLRSRVRTWTDRRCIREQ